MYFQTLDEKENCVATFLNGKLTKNKPPPEYTKTWGYSSFLKDHDAEYAQLYCNGLSLEDVCPDDFKDNWEHINGRLKAYYRSFVEAKISLEENCFFDLVPEQFLLEFCELKNNISQHVFETHEKPLNYDFLLDLTKLITSIKYNKLNIDLDYLKSRLSEYKVRQFYKKINEIDPHIKYDMYGTKTGRLTTRKNSFPILTMDKTYRGILRPNNDWFVELDYNAAELRMLLALSGKEQPSEDIHDWNVSNVYQNSLTREAAKKRIFAWLYNPNSKDYLSNRAYTRDKVLQKYWDGTCVKTHFGRSIESDEFHALNYIVQSTASDLILRQAIKVNKLLENKKTNIAFMIHDSIVLDIAAEDESMINDIFREFANTEFGVFKTNARAGKNFGGLKDLWIKS